MAIQSLQLVRFHRQGVHILVVVVPKHDAQLARKTVKEEEHEKLALLLALRT